MNRRRRVLVAGATGYIGRRLVAELAGSGDQVRCLARTPEKLDAESWRAQVEVVTGDVLDPKSLGAAFRDVDAAYYLVHSIGSQSDWQTRDRTAAENFPRCGRRGACRTDRVAGRFWVTMRAAGSHHISRAVMRWVVCLPLGRCR